MGDTTDPELSGPGREGSPLLVAADLRPSSIRPSCACAASPQHVGDGPDEPIVGKPPADLLTPLGSPPRAEPSPGTPRPSAISPLPGAWCRSPARCAWKAARSEAILHIRGEAPHQTDLAHGAPCLGETLVVAELLQDRDRGLGLPLEPLRHAFRLGLARATRAVQGEHGSRAFGHPAGSSPPMPHRRRTSLCSKSPAWIDVVPRRTRRSIRTGSSGIHEGDRSLEERAGGQEVAPRDRSPAARRESRGRLTGELTTTVIQRTELGSQYHRLLEVVREHLLELGEPFGCDPLEPARVALVQLGPDALGDPLVRGVADQCVAEAEAPRSRRTTPAPGRSGRVDAAPSGAGRRLRGRGRLDSSVTLPQWKTRPSTEPRSITRCSSGVSRSSLAWRSPAIVGGTVRCDRSPVTTHPSASGRTRQAVVDQHRDHLLHEQGVALGRLRHPCRHGRGCIRPTEEPDDQLVRFVLGERFELERRGGCLPSPSPAGRPGGPGGPGRAARIGASLVHSATCSIRSSKPGSAQWMSSNTTTSGRSAREGLEELADRPDASPRVTRWPPRVRGTRRADPRRSRRRRSPREARRSSSGSHRGHPRRGRRRRRWRISTTGQYVMPSP